MACIHQIMWLICRIQLLTILSISAIRVALVIVVTGLAAPARMAE